MTTYFDTEPRRCPYCRRDFTVYDNAPFNIGQESQCECGFLYAMTPGPRQCGAGHDARYEYTTAGKSSCTACDLTLAIDKITALEALMDESDKAHAEHIKALVAGFQAASLEMIREEARAAMIEAYNMPLGELLP